MNTRYGMSMVAAVVFAGAAALSFAAGQVQDSTVQGVTVALTPPDFAQPAETWEFAVSLQTHVRDLDDDLAQAAILIAEGKRYAPLGWSGAPPGGHHRKGVLRFKTITPRPQSVAVEIHLKGENLPRSFSWPLK